MNYCFMKWTNLLKKLISTPSFSREEDKSADLLYNFLIAEGVMNVSREGNNVWAFNRFFNPEKPTILLNSHHDTVRPNPAYSRDPFEPAEEDGKIYGLGSNDAGASVVALAAAFLHFYNQVDFRYNLCLALTAEEEVSGRGGIESLLPLLPEIDFAIVGEPTLMQMAVAERGLMVLDCLARGKAGHAAREEGENSIYKALKDIEWFRNYRFARVSPLFGAVKMSVTVIGAGSQHNVVPAECRFTVDVRTTECYTNQEVLSIIRENVDCEVLARSMRLKPSSISLDHPLVKIGLEMGLSYYGSPTTSDQALLSCPSLKMGVGDSARSHTADEYVYIEEIAKGIEQYKTMLYKLLQ